ncbi:hypothetical protein [Streptomyces sp. NPDC048641]|uniref:hypothetical protein n=1 Tax=Streptomyces sp. NPDC048641 TaxID=3154825 RepID=UPI00341476A3
MGDFKMTGDFAGAMVTVIPIILLLGGAEMLKLSKMYVEAAAPKHQQATAEILAAVYPGAEVEGPSSTPSPHTSDDAAQPGEQLWASFEILFALVWGLVAVAHVYMEVKLIQWLATTERPAAPILAERVTGTATLGFVMLLVSAFGPIFMIALDPLLVTLAKSRTTVGRILRLSLKLSLSRSPLGRKYEQAAAAAAGAASAAEGAESGDGAPRQTPNPPSL